MGYPPRILYRTSCAFLTLFFIFLLQSPLAFCQAWSWVNKIGIGGQYDETDTRRSVTDADGNTYVVGNYYGNIVLGETTYNGPNFLYGNFYLAKFDSQGKIVWSNRFNGTANADELSVDDIQIDKTGRVYITGSFSRSVAFGNEVKLTIPPTYNPYDTPFYPFVVQYSSDGVASWARFAFGGIRVTDEKIYSFGELINGFSTNSQWNSYLDEDHSEHIKCYDSNAQLIQNTVNPQHNGSYQYSRLIVSDNSLLLTGYGVVSGLSGYHLSVSKFDPVQNKFDDPVALPGFLSQTEYKFYKNAIYFLGCFPEYGNGQLQFGNILLVSSDAAKSYHTEGYLVKYDLTTNQFVWGKTIRTMDCGFNHLLETNQTDVVYVSFERVGTNSTNSIRAYSISGDSLWTQTSRAYIMDHNGLGADRDGNVYVTGTVSNGVSSKAYFGSVGAFTYDYSVGFLAKISPVSTPGLMVTSKSPATNETNVSVTRPLQLTFSEPIFLGGGNINIYNAITGASIRSLVLTSSNATISGNQVSIKLPSSLPVGITVYVQLNNNAFVDLQGDSFGGISDRSWSFSTAGGSDITSPTLVSTTPAKNATNVDASTSLVLNFSENILPGTGSFYFYDASTDALLFTMPISSSNTTVANSKATVALTTPLPYGKTLYVKTDINVFKDGGGNAFAGISDKSWSFTMSPGADTQSPILLSTSPAAGATNVNIGTTLEMNFSETIVLGNGDIKIHDASTNEMLQSISVSSSNTDVTGVKATITLPSLLPQSRILNITIDNGVFKDAAANSYAGVSGTGWSFTTASPPDTEAPSLTSNVPVSGATNVSGGTILQLNFSENILLNSGSIRVFNASTDAQVATITLTSSNTVITGTHAVITPPTALPANTVLYVMVDHGTFLDLAGNAFAWFLDKSWSFTTAAAGDLHPPLLLSKSPLSAVNVNPRTILQLYFSENISLNIGSIRVFNASTDAQIATITLTSSNTVISGQLAVITPPTALPANTALYVKVDNGTFRDLMTGNVFTGIQDKSWSFTTAAGDLQAPMLLSKLPVNSAVNVDPRTPLQLTLNEDIVLGTGSLSVLNFATNAEIANITLSPSNTAIAGSKITITPDLPLPGNVKLYLKMDNTTISDRAGNYYAGISDKSWSFSTSAINNDITAPVIVSNTPVNNSDEVDPESSLTINFNEPVILIPGQVKVIYYLDGFINLLNINLTNTNTSIEGKVVTIRPDSPLPSGQKLSILVDNGRFKDVSGNLFKGITNLSSWTFHTMQGTPGPDLTPPSIVGTMPASGAADIDPGTLLTIRFNEYVVLNGGNMSIFQEPGKRLMDFNLSASNTTIDKAIVTITLPHHLPVDESVYIKFAGGIFADTAGNAFTGIVDKRWKFTTEKLITAIEGQPLQSALTIHDEGDLVRITTASTDVTILGISDILGRTIDFYESDNGVVFPRPSGVFIVQGRNNNERYMLKLFLR